MMKCLLILALVVVVAAFPKRYERSAILVQQGVTERNRTGGIVPGNGCICVPYWQCINGHILTTGAGLIDPRKRQENGSMDSRCDQNLQLCCLPPGAPNVTAVPTPVATDSCVTEPLTTTSKPYQHRCGIRRVPVIDSRILTAGRQSYTKYAEWPWQAALLTEDSSSKYLFEAGAVLIDDRHVLTVAHHVFDYVAKPNTLTVRLGAWNLSSTVEQLPRQNLTVEKVIVHPLFDNASLHNDIAVLRLKGRAEFAENIDTICLPGYNETHVGQQCYATGWGEESFDGNYSRVLKEVPLPIVGFYACQDALRQTRLGTFFDLDRSFVCAGGAQGLDACIGDGGGPLACARSDGTYSLVGLVSWGINCGQPGIPGVYVDVTQFLDWIATSTDRSLSTYWPNAR